MHREEQDNRGVVRDYLDDEPCPVVSLVSYRLDKQTECAQSKSGHSMMVMEGGGYSCERCHLAVQN